VGGLPVAILLVAHLKENLRHRSASRTVKAIDIGSAVGGLLGRAAADIDDEVGTDALVTAEDEILVDPERVRGLPFEDRVAQDGTKMSGAGPQPPVMVGGQTTTGVSQRGDAQVGHARHEFLAKNAFPKGTEMSLIDPEFAARGQFEGKNRLIVGPP
jgi:hypothetical protein